MFSCSQVQQKRAPHFQVFMTNLETDFKPTLMWDKVLAGNGTGVLHVVVSTVPGMLWTHEEEKNSFGMEQSFPMWTKLRHLPSHLEKDEPLSAKTFFFPISLGSHMPYLMFLSNMCNRKLRIYIINIIPFSVP